MKLDVPVIAILRGIDPHFFSQLMPAAFGAGLQAIEVTMNTSNVLQIIETNRKRVPMGHFLGVGTVCNLENARQAIEAGAMFLVSPNIDEQVIAFAKDQKIPIIAGALTPTEVYRAWQAGADMVKVFPVASMGGPRYIQELRGPFNDIPLVPVGGITKSHLQDYFQAGANAVGIGSSLFGRSELGRKDIKGLTKNVENYINCCLPQTTSNVLGEKDV